MLLFIDTTYYYCWSLTCKWEEMGNAFDLGDLVLIHQGNISENKYKTVHEKYQVPKPEHSYSSQIRIWKWNAENEVFQSLAFEPLEGSRDRILIHKLHLTFIDQFIDLFV